MYWKGKLFYSCDEIMPRKGAYFISLLYILHEVQLVIIIKRQTLQLVDIVSSICIIDVKQSASV